MVGINTPRTQIALPAQGVQELRNTLNSLLEEFGNEDDKGKNSDIYKTKILFFEKVIQMKYFIFIGYLKYFESVFH